MASNRIEERLAALESEVIRLRGEVERLTQPKDWRRVVGMFAGDEVMKQIDEAGQRIREEDRRRTRPRARKGRKKVGS